jgi:hypothetical protein
VGNEIPIMELLTVVKKVCSKCGQEKSSLEFYVVKKTGKLHSWCRDCCNEKSRKEYRKNIEKWRKYDRDYYYAHQTELQEAQRNRYAVRKDNTDYIKTRRAWCEKSARKLRQDFIDAFGGSCSCCGETTYEFVGRHIELLGMKDTPPVSMICSVLTAILR